MAAVLGLSDEQVRDVCAEAAGDQVLEPVNFNSPGQVVLAGDADAVGRALVAAKAAGAKRAVTLPVSVPSHCALMRPAAELLGQQLADVAIAPPKTPVIHNVSVAAESNPEKIRDLLVQQLYSPVRWSEIIRFFADAGATALVEAGPGKVLTGLTKRIDRKLGAHAVFDTKGLASALEATQHA
jgi:[acyl-carrier-protein] S-malonyltransferase